MGAGVDEDRDATVVLAHREHRHAGDVVADEVAGRGDIVGPAEANPFVCEDRLDLAPEKGFGMERRRRHGPRLGEGRGGAGLELGEDGAKIAPGVRCEVASRHSVIVACRRV